MSNAGRNILIRILGGKCEICESQHGLSIHHMNGNHDDNDIKNLELLYRVCHGKSHPPQLPFTKNKKEPTDEGIIEYLSRPARGKLVFELCRSLIDIDKENQTRKRERGRPPVSGVTILASLLGVSRKSVGRWLAGDMQSSNVNAGRLLDLALLYVPDVLEEVLFEDLERHRVEVESFLGYMGVGRNS